MRTQTSFPQRTICRKSGNHYVTDSTVHRRAFTEVDSILPVWATVGLCCYASTSGVKYWLHLHGYLSWPIS